MKNILNIFILTSLLYCFTNCSGYLSDNNKNIEITFSDYNLPMDCMPEIEYDKIYKIVSATEFKQFFGECPNAEEIDFSTHSVILLKGVSNHGISKFGKSFVQIGDDKYLFSVNVFLNDALEVPTWYVAILVPALSPTSKVSLNITQI